MWGSTLTSQFEAGVCRVFLVVGRQGISLVQDAADPVQAAKRLAKEEIPAAVETFMMMRDEW